MIGQIFRTPYTDILMNNNYVFNYAFSKNDSIHEHAHVDFSSDTSQLRHRSWFPWHLFHSVPFHYTHVYVRFILHAAYAGMWILDSGRWRRRLVVAVLDIVSHFNSIRKSTHYLCVNINFFGFFFFLLSGFIPCLVIFNLIFSIVWNGPAHFGILSLVRTFYYYNFCWTFINCHFSFLIRFVAQHEHINSATDYATSTN